MASKFAVEIDLDQMPEDVGELLASRGWTSDALKAYVETNGDSLKDSLADDLWTALVNYVS